MKTLFSYFGHLLCSFSLLLVSSQANGDSFKWIDPPVSGAFSSSSSWSVRPGGPPGAGDFAIFPSGTYTVTCSGASTAVTEVGGNVTFVGSYNVGEYFQGLAVVLQNAALQGGPFTFGDQASLLVDGSDLTMNGFTFGFINLGQVLTGIGGATIKSSGQQEGESLPTFRLEGGSTWQHTGALNVNRCFISGASLSADTLTVRLPELDGGRIQAGRLNGGGHAFNGSNLSADTASMNNWLLEGSGTAMQVSGTTVPGTIYADINIMSGATFSAGALADNAWYTVDGSGSQLTVAGLITAAGPQKITIQNLGQGSSASLSRAFVIVRDAGSLFSFANKAEDSTVQIQNGGRINGVNFIGPSAPSKTAGGSVSGAGSALVLSGNLDLGMFGESSVNVDNGGRIESLKSLLDGGKVGGFSSGSVFGTDSFWLAKNGMAVGITKGVATLNLGDGGRVEVRGANTAMSLGLQSGSEGRMDVDGGSLPAPSALDTRLTAETGVGVGGKGLLTVRRQGRILASKLTLGVNAGSDGTMEVIGAGTSLEVDDTLEVGRAGAGLLTIFGASVTAQEVLVGSNTGTNLLRLTGAGSTLTVAKALRVGADGIGQLSVEQGGQVILTGTYAEPDLTGAGLCGVGANGGATGYISVKGPGSALLGLNGFLNLGLTGSGNLTVTNGGEVHFAAISIVGGQNRTSSAVISGAGSVVRARDSLGIGAPFPGPTSDVVTVTAGGLLESQSTLGVGKTGVLRLNGGSAVAGQTGEAPIPGTVLVANFGRFFLGGRLIGSVLVRQGGTFLPGFSPGHAAIEGGLTLAEGTALEIEIGGNAAGTGYDQIDATGAVTLAGHLDIVFRDGFAPTNGQVFEVVKGGSVAGSFSDVIVHGLASGFTYSLAIAGGNSLSLTATSKGVATSRPKLNIVRLTGDNLVITWPDYVATWTLQQTDELPSGSWQSLAAPGNTITVPAAVGTKFYRLISQ